jgi:nucleoside-diphosphate-sugar epimerase
MRVTVFGATGYLGSHTAEQLSLAGHDVLCIVRKGSDTTFLETLPIKIVCEDFSDMSALAGHIEQGSTVFNCVAETRGHLSDEVRRVVEVELTGQLFAAAKLAGAKRFIQLSTVMIYGFDRPESAIDETYPVKPVYSYSRIAKEREDNLINLQKGSGVELVILRPSNTLGRRDSSALPALMASHSKGSFPVIGGGAWRYSCMDARDVGRAMVHLMGIEVSAPDIFLACGYDTSWLAVKAELDRLLKRDTKLMNIPRSLALVLGRIMELVVPFGKNPPLTRFSVEVLGSHTLFDDTKIRQTGFKPLYNLTETLKDALQLHEH